MLDVLSNTPARSSVAKAAHDAPSDRFATHAGVISGLARFRLKPIYRLGILAVAGGIAATQSTDVSAQPADISAQAAGQTAQLAQVGEGEGKGEGEGEGAGPVSVVSNDIAYLTQLELIRGHLNVGVDLYRHDHAAAAGMHMKHPQDELYAALLPAFDAREVEGFEDALETLAGRVADGAPIAEVDEAFAAVEAHLDRAEQGAEALGDIAARFRVVVNLIRTAAEEYAIAVVDGRMVNAHEYQDALGFTRVARGIVEQIAEDPAHGEREGVSDAITVAREQIDSIQDLWVGLMPPEMLDRDPARLYGAAARVELAVIAID